MKPERDKPRGPLLLWAKRNAPVLVVIAAGLLLLLLPGLRGGGQAEQAQEPEPERSLTQTETQLAALLSRVEGAGEVEVMLALETDGERTLAANRESVRKEGETEDTETAVVLSGDDGEETVTLQTRYPRYRGAVVVSRGADDASVVLALTRAVSAVTGLGADRITVVKMNGS